MNYIFCFSVMSIIFLNLIGCSPFCYQSPRYVKLAHEITNNIANKLEAEEKLHLVGTGGQMMDDIKMIAMSFNYYNEANFDKVRKLTVRAINEYLTTINNNVEIKPFLHEYPFTAQNVEVRIWFLKHNQTSDKISCISSANGIIYYYSDADKYSLNLLKQETYEEAINEISIQSVD